MNLNSMFDIFSEVKFDTAKIKIIALLAMVVDHLTLVFLDDSCDSWHVLRFFGRLTLPLMCLLLVEGFYHTKSLKKYFLRLFVFALFSQVPFILMIKGWEDVLASPQLIFDKGNILFNLILGLGALFVWSTDWNRVIKILLTVLFLFISLALDWGEYVVSFCLVLSLYRENDKQRVIAYLFVAMAMLLLTDVGLVHGLPMLVMTWMPLGILFAGFFIYYADGSQGKRVGGRYFFYAFYPAHMFLISIIDLIL